MCITRLLRKQKTIFWFFFSLGIFFILLGTALLLEPKFYFCRLKNKPVDKQSLYCLINKTRHKNKLQLLKPNTKLEKAAQIRAFDIIASNQFSHQSVNGKDKKEATLESGYNFILIGEILARKFLNNDDLFGDWMNSASHKANILSNNFTDIGIGVAYGTYQNHERRDFNNYHKQCLDYKSIFG